MKRILIVKTTSMGDVIHALPVLHDLKHHNPGLAIDWMVEAPFADLVKANSLVHRVVPVQLRVWRKQGLKHLWQQWKALRSSLADTDYDAVIDLQGLLKSALLACAANGPRMGPGFGYAKEGLAALFYSRRAGWDPQAHAVERLRELAAGLLNYRLQGPPVFYSSRPGKQVPAIPKAGEIWFLHATARDEKKWPLVQWRELAHRFSDLGYRIYLPWGSAAEELQAQAIAERIDHVEVLPRMNLAQLSERMQQAHLVIGVDTGLTHLAAAHYLPLVALFFATPAWRFAPRFNPHAISLGDVGRVPAVGEVFEAASRLIRGNKL
ncbi:lipopolysaccharide heptosyltransferase I [Limnobacter humi]|uniref:Lipopolysaccharide heptosyltransferase 1 n=1 Tax=Limnobacter humi TaxID=1778671 RepID=A0ABT1WCE5_9BURK|nr:lipopolysaccharide heptosyltransferase I [Limnobacter humi]MCQ8895189.1 lipopolysaccharide heptosyltransferase I [Limnobacter humi]